MVAIIIQFHLWGVMDMESVALERDTQEKIDIAGFADKGYLIFESLLSPAECAGLRHEIDNPIGDGAQIPVHMPAHTALATHPRLMRIARTLMNGKDYAFHHMHSARHDVGMAAFPWHHDYEQFPQIDRAHTMIHFFMYLNGLNGTIGDLLMVPGSHRHIVDRYVYSRYGTHDVQGMAVINKLPPGSVIVLHSAVLHARRAMPGGQGMPRYFIDSSYCQYGTRWPAYRERGNWREILQFLTQNDQNCGGNFQFIFEPGCFYS